MATKVRGAGTLSREDRQEWLGHKRRYPEHLPKQQIRAATAQNRWFQNDNDFKRDRTGRSGGIRTRGPYPPRVVRYRAALRSDQDGRGYNTLICEAKALFLVVGAQKLTGRAQFGQSQTQRLDLGIGHPRRSRGRRGHGIARPGKGCEAQRRGLPLNPGGLQRPSRSRHAVELQIAGIALAGRSLAAADRGDMLDALLA